jgi:hypothetical protein
MDLTKASWRITEAAARDMVTDTEDSMIEADAQNTILVAQRLLDNSFYMVDTASGEKRLTTQGDDGRG